MGDETFSMPVGVVAVPGWDFSMDHIGHFGKRVLRSPIRDGSYST
jgi:hypothetical protein